jgi:3-methyladenine DNA glycosylase AlkC
MKASPGLERRLLAALQATSEGTPTPSFEGVLAALDSVARPLKDDPKAQKVLGACLIIKTDDQRLAVRLVASHLAARPGDLQAWAGALLAHEQPSFRAVGVGLLPHLYPRRRRFAATRLVRSADDDNWIVREWAGSAAGHVLNAHFDEFYPVMERWTRHASENVRRAVVIATMMAFDRKRPQQERAEPLLRLHDALISDRAEYVRVNLGPFAIGAMILSHYPEATLKRLRKWARLQDEAARWNVAMVWTSAGARKYVESGIKLLTLLATDERRFVWRAVASAMVKLARARPAVCRPVVEAWARDPKRAHVAEVVRQHLK